MRQAELEKAIKWAKDVSIIVYHTGTDYSIGISINHQVQPTMLKTTNGKITRVFKSADTVTNMLYSIGITEYRVIKLKGE